MEHKYWKLFTSIFRRSACTFGGGFVIIPLMCKKFVEELGWIREQDMLDLTAIAQSSPGAIAVNVSILVGYHVAGIPGAMFASAGISLVIMALYGQQELPADLFDAELVSAGIFAGGLFVLQKWKTDPICVMAGSSVMGVLLYSVF